MTQLADQYRTIEYQVELCNDGLVPHVVSSKVVDSWFTYGGLISFGSIDYCAVVGMVFFREVWDKERAFIPNVFSL